MKHIVIDCARERLLSIGTGAHPKAKTHCYLGWSKVEALTDWVLRSAGSLDVAENSFALPQVEFLPRDYLYPDRFILRAAA